MRLATTIKCSITHLIGIESPSFVYPSTSRLNGVLASPVSSNVSANPVALLWGRWIAETGTNNWTIGLASRPRPNVTEGVPHD